MAITLDTHGGVDSGSISVTNQTVTLTVTAGDLIVAAVSVGNNQTSNLTVSDNVNSGNYTQALSPNFSSTINQTNGVWYFANSAGGSITVKAALASGSNNFFALTAACFKGVSTSTSGVLGPTNTATGSTANASGTSVTPAQNGALIFSSSQMDSSGVSGAGSGFSLLDNEGTNTLLADEYEIQATAASISATWSNSAQAWVVQTAVFYPPSGTVTMDWTSPEELHAKAGSSGFYYDGDPDVAGQALHAMQQFPGRLYGGAREIDETSRNFDCNVATQQPGYDELSPPLPEIFGNPFEWDGADISRNIDQFLAQQQLLDSIDQAPQNFYPAMDWTPPEDGATKDCSFRVVEDESAEREAHAFSPTMDWTTDYDWHLPSGALATEELKRDSGVVEDEDYYNPAPYFSLFGWDEVDWQHSIDTRVVEDEDERELAWPIPAAAQLLNLGWDQDASESRWFDTRVVTDQDELAARPFAPTADWTTDYDWQYSTDTRVVEDEDEHEIAWPIPIVQQILSLWDQDGQESRWFGSAWSIDQDESMPQPYLPLFGWDEIDWQRSTDTRVVEDENDALAALPYYPFQFPDSDEPDQRWFHTRVVEDEDERVIQKPTPILIVPTMDWTQEAEYQRWLDTWVVEDEDAPAARQFAPALAIDDADWVQVSSFQFPVSSFQAEDRNNLWPLVVPPPVLLGYDQDSEVQRWFGTWVVEDESDVREARPFHPTVGYDDWDWSKNLDIWVIVQEDMAERSMITIFPQIIAMAVQQMLCSPLLGLQMMAALPLMLCQGAQAAPGEELGLEEVRIDV